MRSKKPLRYHIKDVLPVPEVFKFVEQTTQTPKKEMIKIFNYGVGLAVFTETETDAQRVVELAAKNKLKAVVAGEVQVAEVREVFVEPWNITLESDQFLLGQ